MPKIDKIEGEEVVWMREIHVEKPNETYLLKKLIFKKTIYYALTRQKAYILEGNQIVQSADVSKAVISIVNKRKRAVSLHGSIPITKEIGDVIFMQNGEVLITFEEVPDADTLVKIFESIRKSEKLENFPVSQPETSIAKEVQENVIWKYGPVYIYNDNLWKLKKGYMGVKDSFAFMFKHKKVNYIVTNKQAKIVSEDGSTTYAQIDLQDCVVVSQNSSMMPIYYLGPLREETPRKHWDDKVMAGDVIFVKDGKPVMAFEEIPNPDILVDMINNLQKSYSKG